MLHGIFFQIFLACTILIKRSLQNEDYKFSHWICSLHPQEFISVGKPMGINPYTRGSLSHICQTLNKTQLDKNISATISRTANSKSPKSDLIFLNKLQLIIHELRFFATDTPGICEENSKALQQSKDLGSKQRFKRARPRHRRRNDISIWIDENQVRMFSGYNMEIYVIIDGRVMPYILEPDFENQLPVIPSEVEHVNFTWKSDRKRYYYNFDQLWSFDETILQHPFVSVNRAGRVPRRPKVFSVRIPCAGNASGIATFGIGLRIQNGKGTPLPDTPLRLRLRKECELAAGPDPACDEKCANGGVCDQERRCRCPMGYMGKFCTVALCYPQCLNGGTCTDPGRCSCPPGYHGRICEGGICRNKCLNGGKCVQKDTCFCQKGFYGNRCEFSKCVIPCVNGGKCRGVNKCRCKAGFSGDHCEIITTRGLSRLFSRCSARCRHGSCVGHGDCKCKDGYTGKWCRRRVRWKKKKTHRRKKLWV